MRENELLNARNMLMEQEALSKSSRQEISMIGKVGELDLEHRRRDTFNAKVGDAHDGLARHCV